MFQDCANLTDIGTPNISSISYGVFRGCGLTSVDLSNSTFTTLTGPGGTDTSNGVFAGCANLQEVILPTTCTSIGQASFSSDKVLTTISGVENVTSLGNYAFDNCWVLSSFPIGNLTNIGTRAFYNCYAIGGVVNAPNLTSIGNAAFRQTAITRVDSLGSITTLPGGEGGGDGVFRECANLKSVNIPSTLISFGQNTFADCTSLESITINTSTPPTWGTSMLSNDSAFTTIFVPVGSIDTYLAANKYSNVPHFLQEIGHNKWTFDYGNIIEGKVLRKSNESDNYINPIGGDHAQINSCFVTDYIEIPDTCETLRYYTGITKTIYNGGGWIDVVVKFFDENKAYLTDYELYGDNATEGINVSVPENAKYIRLSMRNKSIKNFYYVYDVTNKQVLWPTRTESNS